MLTSQHCDPFCLSSPHKTYLYQYRLQQSESIEKETVAWTLSMSSQTCLQAVYTARDACLGFIFLEDLLQNSF